MHKDSQNMDQQIAPVSTLTAVLTTTKPLMIIHKIIQLLRLHLSISKV